MAPFTVMHEKARIQVYQQEASVCALNQMSDLSMTPEQVTTSSCTHEHYCIIDRRHAEVANSAKNSKHKITFDKITLKPNRNDRLKSNILYVQK